MDDLGINQAALELKKLEIFQDAVKNIGASGAEYTELSDHGGFLDTYALPYLQGLWQILFNTEKQ